MDRLLSVADLLKERLFPSRLELPERQQRYYEGRVWTRQLPRQRTHALTYAY